MQSSLEDALEARHHERAEMRVAQDRAAKSAPTVLVVEDSEVIRRVLKLVLEAEGYRVLECADGRRVMDLARDSQPDAITLDLCLPGVDGRELLRILHGDKTLGRVPVIVVSAFADGLSPSDRSEAADVILKPFDLDDLLERVGRAIRSRPGGDRLSSRREST